MAAAEASLTWGGLAGLTWSEKEEEESMATMRARLQAMTWAAQAKDTALEDLQRRLKAALEDAGHGRAREAALQRRAEKSEEAEEALASQMAELEAEAFTHITETNKLLAAAAARNVVPITSIQVGELQRRLQAALEDAAAWARRCQVLEEEVEQGRVREASLQRQVEIAEEAEEALASQMAELEAEAFARITGNTKLVAGCKGQESDSMFDEWCNEEPEPIASSQVAELERRLAGADETLHAKLREVEEKNRSLELRLAQLAQEEKKQGGASEETLLSLSRQDLAEFVKLKIWNPSSLTVTSPYRQNLLCKTH